MARVVIFLSFCTLAFAGCITSPEEDTSLKQIPAPSQNAKEQNNVAANSTKRKIQKITVRVRNLSCTSLSNGSGFAIGKHTLITNRHVIEGAKHLEISTWDGKTLTAKIHQIASEGDIAVVQTEDELPLVATLAQDPKAGDQAIVVGYPGGGPLTLSYGKVLGYLNKSQSKDKIPRIILNAKIKQGSSGGPVVNENGQVVGVIVELDVDTKNAIAIPISNVRMLAKTTGKNPQASC